MDRPQRPAGRRAEGVRGHHLARAEGIRVTFARLRAVDWIAFVAALALLFFMAIDWYTDKVGEANRTQQHRFQRIVPTDEGDQAQLAQESRAAAESHERNAW